MGKRKATVQPEDEASSYEDEQSVDDTAYYSIRCITGRAPQTQRSGLAEPKEVKAEFKAFQIVDPDRAADSAAGSGGAQPIHRTVRPGDTVLADSGSANGAKLGPFIALVRQVYRNKAGAVTVRVSWLYRPQEAVSQGAKPSDGWRPKEIMYSRHFDTLDPFTVLHPCQVHFLPYGAPEPSWVMGSTDEDLHERPVPGFLCFRTWDITRKKLVRNTLGQRPNDFIDADDRAMAQEMNWLMGLTSKRLAVLATEDKSKWERLEQLGGLDTLRSFVKKRAKVSSQVTVPRPQSAPTAATALPRTKGSSRSTLGAPEGSKLTEEAGAKQRPWSAEAGGAVAGKALGPTAAGAAQHSAAASRAAAKLTGLLKANRAGLDDCSFNRAFDYVGELMEAAGPLAENPPAEHTTVVAMTSGQLEGLEASCSLPCDESMRDLIRTISEAAPDTALSLEVLQGLANMGLVRLLGAWLCVAHRNFICTGIGSECLAAILAAVHLVPVDGDATRSWAAHVDFKRTLSALSHVTAGSVAKNACLIQDLWERPSREIAFISRPAQAAPEQNSPTVCVNSVPQSTPAAAAPQLAAAICGLENSDHVQISATSRPRLLPAAGSSNVATSLSEPQQQQFFTAGSAPASSGRGRVILTPTEIEVYISVLKEHGYNLGKIRASIPDIPAKNLVQFWKNHTRAGSRLMLLQYLPENRASSAKIAEAKSQALEEPQLPSTSSPRVVSKYDRDRAAMVDVNVACSSYEHRDELVHGPSHPTTHDSTGDDTQRLSVDMETYYRQDGGDDVVSPGGAAQQQHAAAVSPKNSRVNKKRKLQIPSLKSLHAPLLLRNELQAACSDTDSDRALQFYYAQRPAASILRGAAASAPEAEDCDKQVDDAVPLKASMAPTNVERVTKIGIPKTGMTTIDG